jgi:hypothetical protein
MGKRIGLKNVKGRDYLGDLGICVGIMFKRISFVIDLIRLNRIGTWTGSFEHGNQTLGYIHGGNVVAS